MKWIELDVTEWKKCMPPEAQEMMRNHHAYQSESNLRVLYSEDKTPKWGWLKHLSVSCKHRYPGWDEILAVKIQFFGDNLDCIMVIPKKEDYVNVHKNCFHIWQCTQEWGIR